MIKLIKKNLTNLFIKKSLRFLVEEDFDSALKWVNKTLFMFPNCEKAMHLKGKIYQISGRLNEAIIWYDKLININSEHIFAWSDKAACLATCDDYDEALKVLDDGLNFNSNDYYLIKSKIQIFIESGRYNEGFDYANSILNNLNRELGIELKAELFLSEGKFNYAFKCFHKLSVLNNKNIDSWYGLSSTSYYLGNLDNAIEYMEKCVELDNENLTFLLLYTSYLSENKSYDKALKLINESIKKYNDINFYYLKGVCLEFLNNEKEAEKTYKKGLEMGLKLAKLYPNENFHDVICTILEKLNTPNETEKYYNKFYELNS